MSCSLTRLVRMVCRLHSVVKECVVGQKQTFHSVGTKNGAGILRIDWVCAKIGVYVCRSMNILLTITWITFTGQYKSLRLYNTIIERYLLIINYMRNGLSKWVCSDETALCRCNVNMRTSIAEMCMLEQGWIRVRRQ